LNDIQTPARSGHDALGNMRQPLLKKAVDGHGLQLRTATRKHIKLLNKAHKENWPRYPRRNKGPTSAFVIDNFESDADDLFTAVRIALYGRRPR
jgi:hypothetical protein